MVVLSLSESNIIKDSSKPTSTKTAVKKTATKTVSKSPTKAKLDTKSIIKPESSASKPVKPAGVQSEQQLQGDASLSSKVVNKAASNTVAKSIKDTTTKTRVSSKNLDTDDSLNDFDDDFLEDEELSDKRTKASASSGRKPGRPSKPKNDEDDFLDTGDEEAEEVPELKPV